MESKENNLIIDLSVASKVKPSVSAEGKMLIWSGKKLSLHQLSVNKTSVSMSLLDELQLNGKLQAMVVYGKVVTAVIALDDSKCINQYSVLQWGSLNFAIKYCKAVSVLYGGIGYFPPGATRRFISIDECIRQVESSCDFICDLQQEKEDLYPSRGQFMGCDGVPWTKTKQCYERTYLSWKVLKSRMEVLSPGSSERITSHSVANEAYVEHSFGFTKKKGQGHNQSQVEYTQSKRTHMVDFQMRMCKLPFSQHTKTKIRDKGYQSLESRQVPMSLKEFQEIFFYSASSKTQEEIENAISDSQSQLLKKANLLCKYVPHNSSRTR